MLRALRSTLLLLVSLSVLVARADAANLTVVSAGICLSGMDRNFDLQSLVGVVEDR
jgi:hypothetical protein